MGTLSEYKDFPSPDRERFCVHDGEYCPFSGSCVYNKETDGFMMQVCEMAIQTGISMCRTCKKRKKCSETWTCFRRQRWIRKRATREARP